MNDSADSLADVLADAELAESHSVDVAPETPDVDLAAENAALKEQMLRVAADAENVRRRTEKEANDARAYAIQRFARDLLDAADNLGRALSAAPRDAADPAIKNLVTGIEMTERALQNAFERNGLKQVSPERGEKFDPHAHQAMMEQAADDLAPGVVTTVMAPGYELFGRMIRPAMVAVTPKASAPTPSADVAAYGRESSETAGASVDRRA